MDDYVYKLMSSVFLLNLIDSEQDTEYRIVYNGKNIFAIFKCLMKDITVSPYTITKGKANDIMSVVSDLKLEFKEENIDEMYKVI